MKTAPFLLFVCLLTGCTKEQPSKPRTPLNRALFKEAYLLDDDEKTRTEVRGEVRNYLNKQHPNWQLRGLSLTHQEEDTSFKHSTVPKLSAITRL